MRPRHAVAAAIGAAFLGLATPAFATTSSYTAKSTATPDALWTKVGDFCAIGNWLPPVEKCTLSADGKMRTLSLKGGGEVVEALISRSDAHRTYSYRIVSSPLPVENYRSTIHVIAAPGGSAVVWSGSYTAKGKTPAEAKKVIDGIYKAGADTLVAP
jgi:hypothetical protein